MGRPNSVGVRHGVSRTEVACSLACIALLCVIGVAALGPSTAAQPKTARDADLLQSIHAAMITFARDYGAGFPTPGWINRLPIEVDGRKRQVPGRGEPDVTQNTTANLYSAMIMQNYFPPHTVVSPLERNPNVAVYHDYDYSLYNPIDDVYWDPGFKADLREESHTSYAHLVLYGKRIEVALREPFPFLGNRGPKDGKPDPKSYTCDSGGNWAGHVAYSDNQVRRHTTTTPAGLVFESGGQRKQDNLFAFDDGIAGADAILAFTARMTTDGPVIQHD